jgi:omega-6 fatty acid desaturase (delta-12 desaturase)
MQALSPTPAPEAPSSPRERIAGLLVPFHRPSLALALAIFLTDLAVCVLSFAGFFLAPHAGWRLGAGITYGVSMMMLALVAHDSSHLNFSGSSRLDKWIARVAFLPIFHSLSLWIPVHRLHHAQTHLRTHDFTFAPFTKQEYDRLPGWRRLVERFYRHPIGFGPYYFVEVWLKHFVVPRPGQRVSLTCALDSVLVLGFLGAQLTFLVLASEPLGVPTWEALLGLFVLPHVLWNYVVGFTLYNQHTLETVPWYTGREGWSFVQAQLQGAIHIRWPGLIDLLFHRAMNHTAHHLDARVPPYRLPEAQAFLEREFPETVTVVDWTWTGFLETVRRCKLYDPQRRRWLDFEGRPTT